MKPSEVKEAIFFAGKIQRPIMLWGAPGIGKSQLVYQAAETMTPKHNVNKSKAMTNYEKNRPGIKGRKVYEFRATLLDPVDLRGLMEIINAAGRRVTSWCPPVFLPDKPGGLLFIDELPTAIPLVQVALYQLILDRKLGEYVLPEDTVIVCAGNMEGQNAAVNKMPSPLANRFIHLVLESDVEEWIDWAITSQIAIEVVAYIRFRPSVLSAFTDYKLGAGADKAFCTGRTLEFVSDIIKAAPPKNILLPLLTGTIGKGPGEELFGFLDDWPDLPNIKTVMEHPESGNIPTKPSVLFAVTQALAKIVTDKTMGNFVRYANRLENDGKLEFAMAMITDALSHNPLLRNTKEFTKDWIVRHPELYVRTH